MNKVISPTQVVWNGQPYKLDKMPTDKLNDMLLMVGTESDDIHNQIEDAKLKYKLSGIPADPSWFKSANYAFLCRKRIIQAIENEIRKRELNLFDGVAERFVEVARFTLKPEIFKSLLTQAQGSVLRDKE